MTVERRDDGVALVRLDRPKMNALSSALLEQLGAIASELTDKPPGARLVTLLSHRQAWRGHPRGLTVRRPRPNI